MRLSRLDEAQFSPQQRTLAERISGPRGQVRGPFLCLLHSPALCDRVEALASYLRFRGQLPQKLRELSLLIAARFWDSQDSWNAGVPKAVAAGLSQDVIDALAAKRAPQFEDEQEALLYRFCKELLETHFVSDETYAAAHDAFGEEGLVEAVGCVGTFSMLAMVLNAFEVFDPGKTAPFADIRGHARIGERQPLG